MSKILEVIVTSLYEAIEAERGGADRLELVRSLDKEGLTPSADLVRSVVENVTIPVRVILRENTGFQIENAAELERLRARARAIAELGIDGFVIGFVRDGQVDVEVMRTLLADFAEIRVTFHKAFDSLSDPFEGIEQLRKFPEVDHILIAGGEGSWTERKARLVEYQRAAGHVRVLVGGGLDAQSLAALASEPGLTEFHVGRAARIPAVASGSVRRVRVAELKALLA